jgi:nucleoid-associated protein YgaU
MDKIIQKLKVSEDTISMILGLGVVLLVGGLIFNYFSKKDDQLADVGEVPEVLETENVSEQEPLGFSEPVNGETYEVKAGDSLWMIAEGSYGSGYNWVDIVLENKLSDPDVLLVGQKLVLPKVTPRLLTKTVAMEEITEYVVKKGDSLSKISLMVYQDMDGWERIWEANKNQISDPNLIEIGMKLVIPRSK